MDKLQESIKILTEAIECLTKSHNDLKKEVQEACSSARETKQNLEKLTGRVNNIEMKLETPWHIDKSNNIIIFKLKDNDETNNDLIKTILSIFAKINISIPDVAIADAYRLGKIMGSRPVLVKFVAVRWVKLVFSRVQEFKRLDLGIDNDRSVPFRTSQAQY